jgi:hypothetical protein
MSCQITAIIPQTYKGANHLYDSGFTVEETGLVVTTYDTVCNANVVKVRDYGQALVDMDGKVIGMNIVQIGCNLNLAIPSNFIKSKICVLFIKQINFNLISSVYHSIKRFAKHYITCKTTNLWTDNILVVTSK